MDAPCKNCERKGCGDYHDLCEPYKKFREEMNARSRAKILAEKSRPLRRKYRHNENSPIRCHKK